MPRGKLLTWSKTDIMGRINKCPLKMTDDQKTELFESVASALNELDELADVRVDNAILKFVDENVHHYHSISSTDSLVG